MNQLSLLAIKMNSERLKVLKEDEEHIVTGGKDSDEEGDGFNDDDEDFEDSDEEWQKQQKIFQDIGPKLHAGKALTKEEMDKVALGGYDEDEDEDDDSDYEYMGGDMSLYESKLDEFDELKHLQKSLMGLESSNGAIYQSLIGGITDPSTLN